jgi:hypothetical protein
MRRDEGRGMTSDEGAAVRNLKSRIEISGGGSFITHHSAPFILWNASGIGDCIEFEVDVL